MNPTKWIKLKYISPWTHKPEVCVLTSAEATGRREGFNFAIFDKDSKFGAHVTFYPFSEKLLGSHTINKHEAKKGVDAIHPYNEEIINNFNKTYCEGRGIAK